MSFGLVLADNDLAETLMNQLISDYCHIHIRYCHIHRCTKLQDPFSFLIPNSLTIIYGKDLRLGEDIIHLKGMQRQINIDQALKKFPWKNISFLYNFTTAVLMKTSRTIPSIPRHFSGKSG